MQHNRVKLPASVKAVDRDLSKLEERVKAGSTEHICTCVDCGEAFVTYIGARLCDPCYEIRKNSPPPPRCKTPKTRRTLTLKNPAANKPRGRQL
jgi:hypothetical protein